MPLSFRQAGNTFIQGPNISIYPSGNSYAISGNAPSTGGGFTGLTSAGTGNRLLLSSITNNALIYKSLTGTSNLSINDNDNGTITFSLAGGTGTIISGINVGTNANSLSFFSGLTTTTNPNDTLVFRNLLEGPNIFISRSVDNDGDILISRGSPILVNQISNIGDGARVLSSISSTNLMVARTLLAASGFSQTIINSASTGATSAITASTVVRIAPTNTTASLLYISNATSQLGTSALFGADVTTGSLGIGGAASTTSRLSIAAGTGAISQIKLTAFSAEPTNPSDGSIWYSTSGNTLKFEKGTNPTDFIFKDNNISLTGFSNQVLVVDTGGTITPKYVNSLGEFNVLTSLTVNTTETSIISSSLIGSTTLLSSTNPYNPQLGIGRKFRFNAKGILSFDIAPINLNIIIKLGSTVISSSSTISVGIIGDTYTSEIEIDATFTVRNSGLVVCSGKILFLTFPPSTFASDPVIFGLYSQDATISTTTDQIFDCIVQLDPEEVTNTIAIYESTLEILN